MNFALKNARKLLREANILFQRRAYRRAFGLAVLALEEAGKKVIMPLMDAIKDAYDYLEEAGISSIGELKLKCLYVDISENNLNFKFPYDIPPKVAKGMILITENQISNTSILRDSFRRAKTERLSDDILAIMVRNQEIREILDELSQT